MAEEKRGRTRQRKARAGAKDNVTALRGVRSPLAARREPDGTPEERNAPSLPGRIDLKQVEKLATWGLTLEQIATQLTLPEPLSASERAGLEAAIKRGRAKGSASLKRAHYQAALHGSVSSLKEMLARLEDEDDAETDEEWVVEEVILDGPQGKAGSEGPQD
jgi:hypothetical protein